MSTPLQQFSKIKALVFDIDGVFTNSQMLVTEAGELLRQVNTRDGYAVKRAHRAGLKVCVITGGSSEGMVIRLQKLGVTDIFYGIQDKLPVFKEWVKKQELDPEEVLYMGDDIPDLEVMRFAGFACCPYDAVPEIREISDYISPNSGGQFCVRDVIEKTMRSQGLWTTNAPGITD